MKLYNYMAVLLLYVSYAHQSQAMCARLAMATKTKAFKGALIAGGLAGTYCHYRKQLKIFEQRKQAKKNNALLYCSDVLNKRWTTVHDETARLHEESKKDKDLLIIRAQSFHYECSRPLSDGSVQKYETVADSQAEDAMRKRVYNSLVYKYSSQSSIEPPWVFKALSKLINTANHLGDAYDDQSDLDKEAIDQMANAAVLFARNEARYADTHVAFYHGTKRFDELAERTKAYAGAQKKACMPNFFLLRNLGATRILKDVLDTQEYILSQPEDAFYVCRNPGKSMANGLYPYDLFEPYRTLYLSTCLAATSYALGSPFCSFDLLGHRTIAGSGGAVIQLLVPKAMLKKGRIYECFGGGKPSREGKDHPLLEKLEGLQQGKYPYSTWQARIPLDPDAFEEPGKVLMSAVVWIPKKGLQEK